MTKGCVSGQLDVKEKIVPSLTLGKQNNIVSMKKKGGTVKNTKQLREIAPSTTASLIDVRLRRNCCGQARLGEKVTQLVLRLS